MKTLILFRHAKSSWENYNHDKAREILAIGKERTEKAATFLHNFLQENSILVDTFIASEAMRAQQTAKITTEIFNTHFEISSSLYTFSIFELESIIKSFPDKNNVITIFGHNNAFTDFINTFGNQPIDNLPTSGIAIISFETNSWKKISKGNTLKIIIPKEI